jgi:hypothetical protein
MFIGDVGQGSREEVDVQQPGNPGGGENYGWRDREGFIQNPFFPKATPTPTPIPPRVNPILDYDRNTGGTVIGGYVYRGNQIPGLRGTYVFGDYLAQKIFALNYDGTTASNFQDITSQFFSASTGFSLNSLSSFAEDANGELYITDVGNGNVYKIVPVTPNVEIDSITRDLTNPMVPQIIIRGLGVPFTNVTIQATSDLTQQFAFLTTVPVAGDGTFEFSDTTNPAVRFYRVKYP